MHGEDRDDFVSLSSLAASESWLSEVLPDCKDHFLLAERPVRHDVVSDVVFLVPNCVPHIRSFQVRLQVQVCG